MRARSARRSPAIHSPGSIAPSISAASPSRLGASIPAALTVSAISGTESRPSEACPIRPGIFSAGDARAEQLAGLPVAALGSEHGGGQVADAGQAGEGLQAGTPGGAVLDALAPDAGGGDPGRVEPEALGGRGGQRGGVLGRTAHLDPGHVVAALAEQAGAVEDLAEHRPQVGVGAAEHQRRHPGRRLAGVGGAAERGHRASAHPFGDVLVGQRAHRLHHPLGEQQHRGARADPVGERADHGGQRLRGNGEADQVAAGDLDLARALDREPGWQLDVGEVLGVLASLGDRLRLLLAARAELDLEAAAGE